MYDAEETEFIQQTSNSICYACLCRNRKTEPLGEYAGLFNRIIFLSAEESPYFRVCWECMAVLKKIKIFESKCNIAQRILQAQQENDQPPKGLSTLVMTPVKIDVHFGDRLNETNHGFQFESPFVFQRNNVRVVSNFDVPAEKFDEYFECFTRNKAGNDYLFNKRLSNFSQEIVKNDSVVQTDSVRENEHDVNTSNSSDYKESLSINFNQYKLNDNRKLVKRKGLRKKDLEDHFRMVAITSKMKEFISKWEIDLSELDSWRQKERQIDFYRDKPFACHTCICVFSSLKKKYEHDIKYHDVTSGVFTCDVCTCQFPDKEQLEAHVSTHYSLYRCNLCHFRCISRHVIKWHMRRHKRLVACVHCDAVFATISLFYKHFKANHSEFICDHCGKRCRTKYTLEKHVRHHSEKNICLICNKVYASRNSLRNHSEMKHKESSSEMAYCVKCDKQFPNVPLYRRHVQTSKAHAAERDADRNKKQVCCPICGNVYSRKTYMMNHYRHVHMKQSKHHCTDCDRHFLNRTRYVEHRKYHHEGETKAKNKMCNICGRGFAANRTLVNHIRTHSGERPYECQYCDAKFTQKHGMLSHIKYIHMKSKRRAFQ